MKYRKKPVVVEAFQITEKIYNFFKENYKDCKEIWLKADFEYPVWLVNKKFNLFSSYSNVLGYELNINTLEGPQRVLPGDWIIKGIAGELYPVKPDIFEQTYEEVK